MRRLFFLFTKLILLTQVYSDALSNTLATWYNPSDYNYTNIHNLLPIPSDVNYKSNNTCVTFPELKQHNYTERPDRASNKANIFPENFCYSMLTYNISREDFFDIVNKNLQAFYNYRRLITLWSLFNYTSKSMDDSCVGYFRNVACWTQFPACVDNGDKTWTPSAICGNYCSIYLVRCGDFAVQTLCDRTSPLEYCAGYLSSSFLSVSFFSLGLLYLFLFLW